MQIKLDKMGNKENMFAEENFDDLSMEDIEEYARTLGIDLSKLDFDSVLLPSESLLESDHIISDEIVEEYDDKCLNDFSNVIIVDNLPEVGPNKFKKLEVYIRKIYDSIKTGMVKEDGFFMPVNPETQKTLGYCFIEFNSRQEAELAKQKTNNYDLDNDQRYILAVNLMGEFDRLITAAEPKPEEKPYICEENLQYWLTDKKARDQFLVNTGSNVEVYWNDQRLLKPELVHTSEIVDHVQWSPLGTYLAVAHEYGVVLKGGATAFHPLVICIHPQVKLFDFSPSEKFLVTYSIDETSSPDNKQRALFRIFDTRNGKLLRGFSRSSDDQATDGTWVPWPLIRWDGGKYDKYFATMERNFLVVHETERFLAKVKELPLKIMDVQNFSWSPTDPIIAVFIPGLHGRDEPARVILMHVQSKTQLRRKNLFNIFSCKMHWHASGDYLAIQVDHHKKETKGNCYAFLIFWIKERDIPVEVLTLEDDNDKIVDFAWEPKGHRFAIIHGDQARPDISFYSIKDASNTSRVLKLKTLRGKQANTLNWSPAGRFIVLAGMKDFAGKFEFYDANGLKTIAMAEHYLATDIEWDPTGRYVVTSVCYINEFENGFIIWSFFGKMLCRIQKEDLNQFSWRPRPSSLLTIEDERKLLNNLKEISKKFSTEDHDTKTFLRGLDQQRRKMLNEEWQAWLMNWRRLHVEEVVFLQQIREGDTTDEEEITEVEEADFEEVLDVKVLVY